MDMAAAESGSTPTAASDGPVYLIMGVCGTGKTSLAQELALRLGLAAHDADDFHTAANKAKMASGTPLDDDDRRPWLDILSAEAAGWARGGGALMACSALKRSYRTQLRASCPSLVTIFLDVPAEELRERLTARKDHYMPASLIDSQLATLEPPSADEGALVHVPQCVTTTPISAVASFVCVRLDEMTSIASGGSKHA